MNDLEPYRLWWRCLSLSNRANWSRKVSEHFGDADGLAWEDWWPRCRHLFVDDTPLLGATEIETPDDFRFYWDNFRADGSDDSFAVWIDLNATKEHIIETFTELLQKKHSSRPGRRKWEGGGVEEYTVAGQVNVQAIDKALDVYEYYARTKEPYWKVGVACKVNMNQMPDKDGVVDSDKRLVLTSTVARYLARAKALISGVERGEFPAQK